MENSSHRRVVVIVVIILLLVVGLLAKCRCAKARTSAPDQTKTEPVAAALSAPASATAPGNPELEEKLTPATLQAPAHVNAGTPFKVQWTGPNNQRDYLTLVRKEVANQVYGNYRDTKDGNPVELLAPIDPGEWELRYVAGKSSTVLARVAIQVTSNEVTLRMPTEVVAGTKVQVQWTGPNNSGDYLTLVQRDKPDGQYGNYMNTTAGSPMEIIAPIEPGPVELRYMTGQGAKVLKRFSLQVVAASIEIFAPTTATVGSKVAVTWSGPNNTGDYLTLVPQNLPDGQYADYGNTSDGSTLKLTALKSVGLAEIRYMSGQGAKVLKRQAILIIP